MKILYLFDQRIELDTRAQKEIAAFVKNGHNVEVYEWNKDENYKRRIRTVKLRGMEIPITTNGIRVKKNRGFRDNIFRLLKFEWLLLVWLLINHKRFDIIYCVNFDTAYVCHLVAKRSRKPYIYDVFDDYADAHQCGNTLNKLIKRMDYRVMRGAKKVILCSEKRKGQVAGPLSNCEIIYNVPDISAPGEAKPREGFTIAYVGNLAAHRMIGELLEITAAHPQWRLECGGDGALRETVQQYAARYKNIVYHGILAYEDVLRLEQDADVIPALYDPQCRNNVFAAPNKVFEAMALGKPTIMVKNTGMDELVEREKTGLVISCDRESLEKALASICEETLFWKKEARRIQETFTENYSWAKMESKLLDALQR